MNPGTENDGEVEVQTETAAEAATTIEEDDHTSNPSIIMTTTIDHHLCVHLALAPMHRTPRMSFIPTELFVALLDHPQTPMKIGK